jgi:hypothetical protein
MLPGFFRFLATWLPLRYMTDGTRSLQFFDGRTEVSLGAALWVLGAYAIGAVLLSGATALAIDWKRSPLQRFGARRATALAISKRRSRDPSGSVTAAVAGRPYR